jgi:hypothetical protein
MPTDKHAHASRSHRLDAVAEQQVDDTAADHRANMGWRTTSSMMRSAPR